MNEPIASGSGGSGSGGDLFTAFYAPLARAAKNGGAEDPLDEQSGLAIEWEKALQRRLENSKNSNGDARRYRMRDEQDFESEQGIGDDDDDDDDDNEETKQSHSLEANTWSLLQALYLQRTAPAPSSSSAPTSSSTYPYTPPLTLVQRAISASTELSELHVVRDWLHSTAYDQLHPAEVRKGYLPYTKNKLKHALRTDASLSKSTLVDALDPDATNRKSTSGAGERKTLDSEDANYEKALLRSLWEYVRVGELDQAVDMCRQSDCSWRAASLSGGKLWEDDTLAQGARATRAEAEREEGTAEEMEADMLVASEDKIVQGNLRRKLWKSMCRTLASTTHLDKYERALYGAISGETDSVIPVCSTWEDHLWVRLNSLLERQIDVLLQDQNNYFLGSNSEGAADSENSKKQIPQEMEEIFNTLLAEPELRLSSREPFHVAQSWIILNRTSDLLTSFVTKLEQSADSLSEPQLAHLLRFFAHLILFLRLLSGSSSECLPSLPEEPCSAILGAYINVLQAHSKPPSIVAFYSASLEPASAIEAYANYLFTAFPASVSLPGQEPARREERRNALLCVQENGIDLASTAKRVVELTLADVHDTLPDFDSAQAAFGLLAAVGGNVDGRPNELIRSVEWLTFDQETYGDALRQANALMRYFLCAGSPFMARRIIFQIPPDLLPSQTSSGSTGEGIPEDEINEYLDYISFFDALQMHTQFMEVWARRPPPTAHKTERMQYAEGLKSLTAGLHEIVTSFLMGDWLVFPGLQEEAEILPDTRRRLLEHSRLRTAYIPELIFRLHRALLDTGREFLPKNLQLALNLSNLVADEKYRLYAEFLGDGHSAGREENRLKEYLALVRETSLAGLQAGANDVLRLA